MEQTTFLTWGLGLVNGLILFGIGALLAGNRYIRTKLDNVGVDMEKMKTWQEGHVKQDDERHDVVREDIGNLWDDVNKLKAQPKNH